MQERNSLGTVNLLADEKIAELDERFSKIAAEWEDAEWKDLVTAIVELRRSISDLNRNARHKL